MADKVWIVLERKYEYNDETYDTTEGGNCVLAYKTEQEADAACERMMIQSIRNGQTYMYYGGGRSVFYSGYPESGLYDVINKYGADFDRLYRYDDCEEFFERIMTAPEEDLIILINHLVHPLYFVQEVELG